MAVRLMRDGREGRDSGTGRPRWTCALVNNMPDAAFVATERQFVGLLDAGSDPDVIQVRRFAMAGVPRGEQIAARITSEYLPLEQLWSDRPDLLIVTGSEPLAPAIEDEPYWDDLVRLLCWARDHVHSMLLSCLAAHAALAVFDGVARTRLAAKCTGVFPQEADAAHPLVAGLGAPLVLPHSRLNAVPSPAVEAAGYQLVLQSEATGWSVITKQAGDATVVLVQGHPEYEPSSLLREYHRDVKRYLARQREELPRLPVNCLQGADWEGVQRLQQRIVGGERDPALTDTFPFEEAGARAGWPWRPAAIRLYANWLAGVPKRSD